MQTQPVSHSFDTAFLALQAFVAAFLWLHDWVSLGRLNNLAAMRGQDSFAHRAVVTLLGAAPASAGLLFSAERFARPYPHWLEMWLWINYGLFFAGLLRAWWIPYLLAPDQRRAARYQTIFAGTHTFLPRRNGIAPDTLHTALHVAIVAILAMLWLRS
jgi:hypothetical protein